MNEDGTPPLRGVGQPTEKPAEFWKNRFEDLMKAPSATSADVAPPPNFENVQDKGQTEKDDGDDDIFKKIWND